MMLASAVCASDSVSSSSIARTACSRAFGITILALRPQALFFTAGTHQPDRDAHAIVGPLHRAFDERVDAKLLRNRRQRLAGALVLHDGGAGDDAPRTNLRQRPDQLVGHAA